MNKMQHWNNKYTNFSENKAVLSQKIKLCRSRKHQQLQPPQCRLSDTSKKILKIEKKWVLQNETTAIQI